MISALISRLIILTFGTLYPAYASYKAVRTKNVKEYVKWMMYWIVYAFFNCTETFTDIFLSWFPFYYEVKVIIVLWLLSPATKGSSTLYRKFVHPMLTRREQEIDEYLNQAKERGYSAVLQLGSKGVNYATNVIMQTALKGGGNLVQTIRRSYSLSDLSEPDVHRTQDEIDEITRPQQRMLRPRNPVARSASGSRHSTGMYFSEVDVTSKSPADFTSYNIRSSEDISSGYSSAEQMSGGLSRTSSMTNANRARFKAKKAEECFIREIPETMIAYRFYEAPPSVSRDLVHDTYNAWKDEVYFDNEQYFQNQISQDKDTCSTTSTSTYKDENPELPIIMDSPEMNLKYDLFKKWLEETKNSQTLDTIESGELSESEDDEFQDPLPVDKLENEKDEEKEKEVVKVDEITPEADVEQEIDHRITIGPKALKESLEEIQNNFRSAIETPHKTNETLYGLTQTAQPFKTDSTIRRSISHCKGKAPAPPINQQPPKDNVFPECSNSRSTSPMPDKPTKKSGIFKTYLPSIFRSDNKEKSTSGVSNSTTSIPAELSTSISEQYHLETEI
ncbi:uncharacterized protein LOC129943189 isoform X2 [Eupeodes corollae]|uniref:uncharacterized protein LOC129943189 isoform X2 n=1 Tax=Eupeodes corollae TaxID=290404 RepID=UPI002490A4CB|nr:uncharacterized protein LOC129943189 isoform X2 [Eupeodes corollae]